MAFSMSEILKDVDRFGKELPWRQRKLDSLYYGDLLEVLEYKKKSDRVLNCGQVLNFRRTENGLKLYQTYFCGSRLCPLCQWRRSMKQSNELSRVLDVAIEKEPTASFLFLTLTIKNVQGMDGLKTGINDLNQGFNRLFKYKKVAKNLLGYFRATEITVNDLDGSYHPHTHVLLMVKPTYFKNSANYIPQTQWTKLFRKALKIDYDPVVNIERVHRKSSEKGTTKLRDAAKEAAKYQVKSSDYTTGERDRDLQVVDDLEHVLAGRRQVTFGGLLRQIFRQLKLDDKADDLVHVGDDDDELSAGELVIARWNQQRKNYVISTKNQV